MLNEVNSLGGQPAYGVSSANDQERGTGSGTRLETDFYDINGKRKRFSDWARLD
jgi:hypothetical protein